LSAEPGVRISSAAHADGAPPVIAVYAFLSLVWSSTWIWIKIGLDGMPALTGAGTRFVLAGLCLLALCAWRRRPLALPPADRRFALLLSAIFIAAPFALVYAAEEEVTSGLAAVLFGCMPLFTAFAAARLLPGEPLTGARLSGIGTGICGLVVVFYGALGLRTGTVAVLAMLGLLVSAALSALSQVLMKRRKGAVDWTLVFAWSTACGGLILLAAGLATEPHRYVLDAATIASVLYLALVGTVVGFTFFGWLIPRIGAVELSLMTLVVPLLALVWGSALYGEPLNLSLAVGAVVVAAGVGLVTLDRFPRPAARERAE
jgi:drug/metabolite transporter (DMT)-like permease